MSIYLDIKKNFKDFSLDVQFENDQDTLGILGPSGCGKSLTLKCLAGLETPDEGIIKVNGKTVFDSTAKINVKPQQRNVGYLFQSYALFPNMTVWQNIEIAVKKDTSDRDKKIKSLVERYELGGFEERYPVNLSGGQQQRVALARIFAYEPEVLLLDEPFSALDSFLRENMQATMLEIIKEYNGDVMMVTHSRDEAFKICDRLLVLDQGRLIGDGGPEALFDSPGTVEVARMTGCKNISAIEKINDSRVFAKDWGFELDVNGPIKDQTHIGIRAHFFSASGEPGQNDFAGRNNGSDQNRFKAKVINEMSGPFEKSVILKNPDKKDSKEIWWICGKDQDTKNLEYLCIDKKDIYLLDQSS